LVVANDKKHLRELLLHSLSTFITLFRHALIALGDTPPKAKRDVVLALAARIPYDASPFLQLLDIREHKAEGAQFDVADVFARYLTAVQQVTAAVDKMLDSTGPRSA